MIQFLKKLLIPEFIGKYLNEKKFYKYKGQMIKIVNFYNEFWPKENHLLFMETWDYPTLFLAIKYI